MKRYERFAAEISNLIRTGILAPGERVPSVRQASKAHGISPSTVFQAYYLLENQGLISARPRSGYFVRDNASRILDEPHVALQQQAPSDVAVSELVFSVLGSLRDNDTVPFGSAFPSPELFPLARLATSMTRGLRQLSSHAVISDMTTGHPDLCRQIAQRYMVNGMQLPTEELVITNGAMEALNLGLQCVTQPGDLVAIEAPAFYATLQVLERLKLRAVEIPVHPRDGIDLEVLENRLETLPIKACWFMSHLQNPLGASLSDARKAQLYALLCRHQLPMLEDDVYAELYFDQRAEVSPPQPVKALDVEGLVMHCGSFSKCLAPGYRVGWISAGRHTREISRLKLMTTISPSLPAQVALADYLQHGGYDRHLRKLRLALETQQTAMLAAIDRYFPADTRVTHPHGGYFLWCELPEHIDSLALFQQALAHGISLAPGPIFSATQGFKHCIRLSYGHPWDAASERAMQTLGELLKAA
ncbi:PLP-dependent aminotransferase family protein [Cobetia marina]|uniref:HTH-type transcriptional regulator NorG n=1 Tax=Cobetia amphilecti TaxID=1055104 RepID=A0AAP4TW14_9GAMM|nr:MULTISPECIES: PLP-dependent aminotransferase family protein [Cobetia]KPM79499.1 GntR family transcriptional regulator [Cobetia sp. UCD-24C]MDO6670784.1 PLP-dependent aminotransferase family protein [Cobetia amphilecti]MDO6786180.1 PLP-dependent aminotransferase family protein [Cobetia marina]